MRFLLALLLTVSVLGITSLSAEPSREIVTKEGADPIVQVTDEDALFNGAIAEAKATLPYFVANWDKTPGANAAVKIPYPTASGGTEHIWFSVRSISGEQVTAVCDNSPQDVPGLRPGDTRTVHLSQLSDWMIVDGFKCYGGYTLRAILKIHPEMASQIDLEFQDL